MRFAVVQRIADAYALVAAADAARDLGLLDALAEEPLESFDLAGRLDLDPVGVALILAALQAAGLVDRNAGGRFFATPAARAARGCGFWKALPSRMRTGAPVTAFDSPQGANTSYPSLVGIMADIYRAAAEETAIRLGDLGPRVLDVGAGASPWSLALVRRDPARHVTAVDRPAVLDVARKWVDDAGHRDAFDFMPADLTRDAFGDEAFDLAIVANVCHLFGEAVNRSLTRRLFSSLRPGGTIAVVDITAEDGQPSPLSTALYALSLFARTTAGEVHAFSSYCAWLREAGFVGVERRRLSGELPVSLIIATRPASNQGAKRSEAAEARHSQATE